MPHDLTSAFSQVFADKIRLPAPLPTLASEYKTATPFPHIVFDDLFSPALLEPVPGEIQAMSDDRWHTVERESLESFERMRTAVDMGPAGTALANFLHSPAFLYLLSEITGIWQLLPDPYLQGAGYASMQRGSFFKIHSDRSMAYDTGLTRRLALIVFLNKSWKPEYEGRLELWSSDATRCVRSIEPLFNKTILFEVADPNYHGVPTPLACPIDRSRQSFICYYHTVGNQNSIEARPHGSEFAPVFYRNNSIGFRYLMNQVTPPIVKRGVRKLLKRLARIR
jgi:hypothetical protein